MNGSIINRTLSNKLLCLSRKFTSSAALLENPVVELAENFSKLDPVCVHRSPINLRALTPMKIEADHAFFLKCGLMYSNAYNVNNLIEVCLECGRLDYALKMFDEIPLLDLALGKLLILQCSRNLLFDDSWRVLCLIHKQELGLDEEICSSGLSDCVASQQIERGMQIHGVVVKNGLYWDETVVAGMIDLYTRSLWVEDAFRVLNDVCCENAFCWNAVASAAVKSKDYPIALVVFTEMRRRSSLNPDAFTFPRVFTACASIGEIEYGKSIHGLVIKNGAEADMFVGNSIVDFYARFRNINDAIKHFELMPAHNAISWAAIIRGFVHKGDPASAVSIFNKVRRIGEDVDRFTISSVVAACANPAMFKEVLQIHCWILKIGLYLDPVLNAPLINAYSKMGAVDLSELAFAEARDMKQVGVWANMISAYVHSENHEKAIVSFCRMLQDCVAMNKFIASSVLSIIEDLILGQQVHCYMVKVGIASEVSVGSSIFTMYSKCGDFEGSLKAFEILKTKDIVSWTSMIAGFAEHGRAGKAIQLFREMRIEESVFDDKILVAVINACSALNSSKLGREIHGFAIQCGFGKQTAMNAALVNMYSKCGDLDSANIIFHSMPIKDPISWSSIISGFSQRGFIEEALKLSNEMLQSNLSLDSFTISSVVGALAMSSKPQLGTHLHARIIKAGLESYAAVGSSLVMMYSKSGSVEDCVKVFQQITNPDLVSWKSMIDSYACHGKGREALSLVELMKKSGIKPDYLTFIGILSACSHAGLVDEGYFHLNSMIRDYGIQPGYKHYACMVDLLGRAGRLEEAQRFIFSMPIEPDTLVWETLLAACKVHGNREIGKLAARKIMELQPADAGTYVLVSNVWAEAGEWELVQETRALMKDSAVAKSEPGWSYV